MGWKDSGLQIILSIIGSGLLLTVLTGLYSEYNKPNIYLLVTSHYIPASSTKENYTGPPKVQYYEIVARNDGRTQATNVTLSMYFFSNVINSSAILHNVMVKPDTDLNKTITKQGVAEPSLVTERLPKLPRDAMIITYVWTDADADKPFYISASYDQGSTDLPSRNYFSQSNSYGSSQSILYPQIYAGRNTGIPFNIEIIIIASILSAISFAIALGMKRTKHSINKNDRQKILDFENEISKVENIVAKNVAYNGFFSSRTWDSILSNQVKRRLFDNPEHYKLVEDFYMELKKRNVEWSQKRIDFLKLKEYNENCFYLARNALNIDWTKYYETHNIDWILNHFFFLPFIIGSSVFILYIFEIFPLSLIFPSLIILPYDVTLPTELLLRITTIDGSMTFTQYELLIYSIIFCTFSFVVRSVVAFKISKIIINRFELLSIDEKRAYDYDHLLKFSFLIMGLPIYSILYLFFYQSIPISLINLTMVSLVLDIIRMSVLILVIPKLKMAKQTINKLMYYAAATTTVLSGILHISLGFMIIRGLFTVWHLILVSMMIRINIFNSMFFIFLTLFITIGVVQLVWAWLITRRKVGGKWWYVGLSGTASLVVFWIIVRLLLPLLLAYGQHEIFYASRLLQVDSQQIIGFIYSISSVSLSIILLQIAYMIITWTILSEARSSEKIAKRHRLNNPIILIPLVLIIVGSSISYIIYSNHDDFVQVVGNVVNRPEFDPSYPTSMAIDPQHHKLYVLDSSSDLVYVINTRDDSIQTNFKVGAEPQSIAVNPNRHKIYVTGFVDIGDKTLPGISVIDSDMNSIISNIPVGVSYPPNNIAINNNTNMIYVANKYTSYVSVLNGNTDSIISNISVGMPGDIAVNPNTNKAYVLDSLSKSVDVINGSLNMTKSSIGIGVSRGDIAINPISNKIYVTGGHSGKLYVIDGKTNNYTAIPVGVFVRGVDVDPTNNIIYVGSAFADRVSVIDGKTYTPLANITTHWSPHNIRFDQGTDKVYVNGRSPAALSIIDSRTYKIVPYYGFLRSLLVR
jgi:YVTN family beta-propeller protein